MTALSNVKELFIGKRDIIAEISTIYENQSVIIFYGFSNIATTNFLKKLVDHLDDQRNDILYVNISNKKIKTTDQLDRSIYEKLFLEDSLIDKFKNEKSLNSFNEKLLTYVPPDKNLTVIINNFDLECNYSKETIQNSLNTAVKTNNNNLKFIFLSRFPYNENSMMLFYIKLIFYTFLRRNSVVQDFVLGVAVGVLIAIIVVLFLNHIA